MENERRVASDVTEERRGNIYIGSEKGWTKTYRARDVRNQASPNRSRETNEMLGIDLTQRSEGQKASGREWVWVSGIDLTQGRGKVEGALGQEWVWVSGIDLT